MDDNKMVAGKVKKPGKRGRKPAKIDLKAKLERSRQSARECRARKKLRYQYLEELVSSKERAICALREELEMTVCCQSMSLYFDFISLLKRGTSVGSHTVCRPRYRPPITSLIGSLSHVIVFLM
ncbi:cAMP-responsive element-binding protein-like 2 isoform X1 [Pagrus major]|uniref:cAMP-responsive element-binding protein-like 2 isoform X1 n=1 Tax=Pagrus major TaxID=143350 RepID=UPI003CC85E6A